MRALARLAGPAVIVFAALVVMPAAAAAEDVHVTVAAPGAAPIGGLVPVTVTVVQDGGPLVGVEVVLVAEVEFVGEFGEVVLGRAVTDEAGVADLSYRQRVSTLASMAVRVEGHPEGTVALTITSTEQGRQVARSDTGVDLPGLGGWVVFALVGAVFAMMLRSVVRLVPIIREGDAAETRGGGWVVVSIQSIVIATAGVLMVVLVRNPSTHGNLDGPDGHHRTPHAHVGEWASLDSPGLADAAFVGGEADFFAKGCASCHGLGGAGGVVGGDLDSASGDELDEFLSALRKGPKGMPKYPEEALSDEQVASLIEYLQAVLDE